MASTISAVAPWVVPLLVVGVLAGLWFARDELSAWELAAASALLVLAAGVAWHQSRARTQLRLQAAWDAYAEREMRDQRRRTAIRRVRTLSTAPETFQVIEAAFRRNS
jgi:uncharacterized membrane protein YfbV (UPF0208 family)